VAFRDGVQRLRLVVVIVLNLLRWLGGCASRRASKLGPSMMMLTMMPVVMPTMSAVAAVMPMSVMPAVALASEPVLAVQTPVLPLCPVVVLAVSPAESRLLALVLLLHARPVDLVLCFLLHSGTRPSAAGQHHNQAIPTWLRLVCCFDVSPHKT